MKKKIKVLLISMITIILILNFIGASVITASASTIITVEPSDEALAEADTMETDEVENGGALDGFVGFIISILRIVPLLLAKVVNGIIRGIGHIGLTNAEKANVNGSLYDILFNKPEVTSLNFFDFEVEKPLNVIRENVAMWYTALRNLAAIVLLVILAYVGVRMALSTIAQEEAKYKKMFKDWLVSFVLLFVLHYLIIFTINLNNGLVQFLDTVAKQEEGVGIKDKDGNILTTSGSLAEAEDRLWNYAWFGLPGKPLSFSIQIANSLGYIVLMGISMMFLVLYIKRMLTVGFLIMISPIITITYSIDKMGDNRSDALNAWMKEFMANILIQPFHCIIYLTLVSTSLRIMQSQGTIASTVFALFTMIFILSAEGIVKKIFGIEASSLGQAMANAAIITGGLSLLGRGKNKGARATGSAGGRGGANKMPKLNKGNSNKPARTTRPSSGASTGAGGGSSASATNNRGTRDPNKKPNKVGQVLGNIGSGIKNSRPWNSRLVRNIRSEAAQLTPGKVFKKVGGGLIKSGFAITGAMLGLSTGKFEAGLAGAAAGASLAGGMLDRSSGLVTGMRVRSREKEFAKEYKKFQNRTSYDQTKMEAFSKYHMNKDPNTLKQGSKESDEDFKARKDYVSSLHMMRDTYKAAGITGKDNSTEMMNTIGLIEDDKIIPTIDKTIDQVQPNVVQNTEQSPERPLNERIAELESQFFTSRVKPERIYTNSRPANSSGPSNQRRSDDSSRGRRANPRTKELETGNSGANTRNSENSGSRGSRREYKGKGDSTRRGRRQ